MKTKIAPKIKDSLTSPHSADKHSPKMADSNSYPCPACGFLVFDEPPGSYAICDVCGWEDDHVQLAHPTMRGGANRTSLLEWQRDLLTRIPARLAEHKGFRRDPTWRPLMDQDCTPEKPAPTDGLAYFHAAAAESPTYYWHRSSDTPSD
jgi:hypothetical protein